MTGSIIEADGMIAEPTWFMLLMLISEAIIASPLQPLIGLAQASKSA